MKEVIICTTAGDFDIKLKILPRIGETIIKRVGDKMVCEEVREILHNLETGKVRIITLTKK